MNSKEHDFKVNNNKNFNEMYSYSFNTDAAKYIYVQITFS